MISVKNATVAFIGSGAVVHAGRDVKVLATQTRDVASVVVGFGGGLVGLQGSIAVVNIGSNFSSDGASNVPSQGGGDSLGSMSDAANTQANGSGGSKVGTLAGSDPTATGATSKVNTATSALTVAGDFGTGAPAAKGTSASILGSAFAGRDVIVLATDTTELNVTAGSIAAGIVGVGVAASIANVEANTEAFIAGNGTISAGRNVTVSAHYALNQDDGSCSLGSLSDCMGRGFAGGGGIVALFGAVIVIHDSSTQSAYIAGGTHLIQATSVTVRRRERAPHEPAHGRDRWRPRGGRCRRRDRRRRRLHRTRMSAARLRSARASALSAACRSRRAPTPRWTSTPSRSRPASSASASTTPTAP